MFPCAARVRIHDASKCQSQRCHPRIANVTSRSSRPKWSTSTTNRGVEFCFTRRVVPDVSDVRAALSHQTARLFVSDKATTPICTGPKLPDTQRCVIDPEPKSVSVQIDMRCRHGRQNLAARLSNALFSNSCLLRTPSPRTASLHQGAKSHVRWSLHCCTFAVQVHFPVRRHFLFDTWSTQASTFTTKTQLSLQISTCLSSVSYSMALPPGSQQSCHRHTQHTDTAKGHNRTGHCTAPHSTGILPQSKHGKQREGARSSPESLTASPPPPNTIHHHPQGTGTGVRAALRRRRGVCHTQPLEPRPSLLPT